MVFVDVCRAIYDYAPQSNEELEIKEGDLLLVLEKSTEDDWWKCKRKAATEDEDEPEGLVPNNYVEKVQPIYHAKALFDYTQQTDEELSLKDEARLEVYDDTDPEWTLVGCNGEYGFAPANYIEKTGAAAPAPAPTPAPAPSASTPVTAQARVLSPPPAQRELAPPPMPARPTSAEEPIPGEADYPDPGERPTPSPEPPAHSPAAALAGIIAQRTGGVQDREVASPPLPSRPQFTPDESEEEEAPPPVPQRPVSQALPSPSPTQNALPRLQEPAGVQPSPPYNRHISTYSPAGFTPAEDEYDSPGLRSPGGFHLYNVHEMVSHLGKNRKMPTTLGINLAKGIIMISPEKSRDGPSQEWTAEKLTHYSIEGKHVFVELVRPSKSIDFHAGAKDTAQEIVQQLGELAGASRAEGFREILAASAGTGAEGYKKGKMLYEFMAQGDDEVTVAVDDEVIVLDDTKSDEWWKVRRLRNGKEGVVPASYVEITGTMPRGSEAVTGLNAARSTVAQNRLEEERLTRQATSSGAIPERASSLSGEQQAAVSKRSSQRSSGDKRNGKDQAKSKPNPARVRTWTDRSGTFKVEAEFIGLRENKIHLHKLNGVKIAVPVSKMAVEDLEYVERATGASLDDDKPLSDIKRRSTQKKKDESLSTNGTAGASIQRASNSEADKKRAEDEDYWFDFFLQCGVNPQICGRYASAFSRDQMSPEILPEVNEQLLRTLGLKEGDILRVTKYLDTKYGRTPKNLSGIAAAGSSTVQDDSIEPVNGTANGGGLFSGPGGALRNNTRKGRPAPAVQTNDVVDEAAFKQADKPAPVTKEIPAEAKATPLTKAPARTGFEDDAWDVKPARGAQAPATEPTVQEPPKVAVEPPKPQPPKLNDDLALLALPLQPTPAPAAQPAPPAAAPAAQTPAPVATAPAIVAPQQTAQQPQGADQALFDKIAALAPPRQRPQPPAPIQQAVPTGLAPPPRAASAPGFNPQQPGGQFGTLPLQPQLTGYQPPQQLNYQVTGLQPQPLYQQPTGIPQPPRINGIQSLQQNFPPLQPQPTGMAFQPQSQFGQQQAMQQYPQQTGFAQQPSYQQALINGQQSGSPFADPPRAPFQPNVASGLSNSFIPPQPTGFPGQQPAFQPQPTGFAPPQQAQLPAAFPPQPTGFPPQPTFNIAQPTGFAGAPSTFQPAPPIPQLPPQQTGGVFGPSQPIAAPLVAQKTGPAPPVRFGPPPAASRLVPQPTGRANLAKATPQNPFGF